MEIQIAGKTFPLAYTIQAQSEIDRKIGGIKNLELLFDEEEPQKSLDNTLMLLHILMDAAQKRERVKNKIMGKEEQTSEIPTQEELACMLEIKDAKKLVEKIAETIQSGSKVTVEVESGAGKKKEK